MNRGNELLAHLDAGYNLARWLLKNDQDARDVLQDSFIRAFRFKGEVENLKPWFLTVVRNTAYSSMKKKMPVMDVEELSFSENEADSGPSPEEAALQKAELDIVSFALSAVSEQYREIFVLREIEQLSYQELAEVLNLPMGTVMSRLARAKVKILELVRKEEQNPSRRES